VNPAAASTIAKALMRLVTPTSGRIDLDGTDIASMSEAKLRPMRSRFQMVFQDPYGSLDPHMTAQEIVAEPLKLQGVRSKAERHQAAAKLIDQVGLPVRSLDKHPAEFSGGQRQRIGIARALASKPELLVCDEATSALGVSVQAQVLRLLKSIQDETGISSEDDGVRRAFWGTPRSLMTLAISEDSGAPGPSAATWTWGTGTACPTTPATDLTASTPTRPSTRARTAP
jgi:ABC-type microcin C transport system duplicated ATPase subunit YejF